MVGSQEVVELFKEAVKPLEVRPFLQQSVNTCSICHTYVSSQPLREEQMCLLGSSSEK